MPVIGSAGHVDHGKTALVVALTGIDTDRLPEEKARGMTTDLGFARFAAQGLGEVGVIDVPGHERFIRNMVAGATGVDGALFVVAADDGWMEQSERHLEVLAALEVPVLAVAVTKADLVAEERLKAVGEDAARRIACATGGLPAWFPVDSPAGRGIPELRAALAARLRALPQGEDARGAHLFVDRAFTLRGVGLVVAGTLRGAALCPDDELVLHGAEEALRVRSLERYGRPAEVALPGDRVALALGRPRAEVARGDLLAAPSLKVEVARSLYLALAPRWVQFRPRPGSELELAVGAAHRMARVWPASVRGFVRLEVEKPLPLLPGAAVVLLRSGGADILAAGRFVCSGGASREGRRELEAALARAATLVGEERSLLARACELERCGFLELESDEAAFVGSRRSGRTVFSQTTFARACAYARKLSECPGGFPGEGFAGKMGLPAEAGRKLLALVAAEGEVALVGGRLVPAPELHKAGEGGEAHGAPLRSCGDEGRVPLASRPLLAHLCAAGARGFDLELEGGAGTRKELSPLCSLGLVVALDSRLFLSREAYCALRDALLAGRKPGDVIPLAEAKRATGLSRKWLLPLMNRLGDEGILRREGEQRRVLRLPEEVAPREAEAEGAKRGIG